MVSNAERDVEDSLGTGREQGICAADRAHELQETWGWKTELVEGEIFELLKARRRTMP